MAETPDYSALPNISIGGVPPIGGYDIDANDLPALRSIKVTDLVGPGAANRQPNALHKRDLFMLDRIEALVQNMNALTGKNSAGGAITPDGLPVYLSRFGELAMQANLNMGNNKITNLKAATVGSDAVRLDQLTGVDTSNFLLRTGGNTWVGPNPLKMSPDNGVTRYQIKEGAAGTAPTDFVILSQLQDAVSEGDIGGMLVDYRTGRVENPQDVGDAVNDPAITFVLDNPYATVYLFDATLFVTDTGGEFEHAFLKFRYDVGTRQMTGTLLYTGMNLSHDPTKSFDVTIPTSGTLTSVVTLLSNENGGSAGSPNYVIVKAAYITASGAPPQLQINVFFSNNGTTTFHHRAGTWQALGFNGFGGAASPTQAGTTYIPATSYGGANGLREYRSAAGTFDYRYNLDGFAGVDKDRIIGVFVRAWAIGEEGNKAQLLARVGNDNGAFTVVHAVHGTTDPDDDAGTEHLTLIPINRQQAYLDLRIVLAATSSGGTVDARTASIAVDYTIEGFLVTSTPQTGSGSGGGSGGGLIYRSPWVDVDATQAAQRVQTFEHELGETPDFVEVLFRYETSPGVYRTVRVDRTEGSDGTEENASVTDIDTNALTVRIASSGFSFIDPDGNTETTATAGQIQVRAGAIVPSASSGLGAQLKPAPAFLGGESSLNYWQQYTAPNDYHVVDTTKPNGLALLQVDLYAQGPDVWPDTAGHPRYYIDGAAGFSREIALGAVSYGDGVAQSTQVIVKLDDGGGMTLRVAGTAHSSFRYRIQHLGWITEGAAPDAPDTAPLMYADYQHGSFGTSDVSPFEVNLGDADVYIIDGAFGLWGVTATSEEDHASMRLKYEAATRRLTGELLYVPGTNVDAATVVDVTLPTNGDITLCGYHGGGSATKGVRLRAAYVTGDPTTLRVYVNYFDTSVNGYNSVTGRGMAGRWSSVGYLQEVEAALGTNQQGALLYQTGDTAAAGVNQNIYDTWLTVTVSGKVTGTPKRILVWVDATEATVRVRDQKLRAMPVKAVAAFTADHLGRYPGSTQPENVQTELDMYAAGYGRERVAVTAGVNVRDASVLEIEPDSTGAFRIKVSRNDPPGYSARLWLIDVIE